MATSRRAHREATLRVLHAGRQLGAAAVSFHTVLADRQGLSASEEKTLDLLQRFGPLTAGELADKSGLAPPSVTGLLDRLEDKGFVKRVTDPIDRRRVRVEVVHERLDALMPLFDDFVSGMSEVCARYSTEELDVIARFLADAARCQLEAASKLSAEAAGSPSARRRTKRK